MLLFSQVVHILAQGPTDNERSSGHLNPGLLTPELLFVTKILDALSLGCNLREGDGVGFSRLYKAGGKAIHDYKFGYRKRI